MSKDKGNNLANFGFSFTGLLTIAFIVLKLCKVIDWSWWWVLSPLWIPAVAFVITLLIIVVIGAAKGK